MKINGVSLNWDEAWSAAYVAKLYGISRQAVNYAIVGCTRNGKFSPPKVLPDEVLLVNNNVWFINSSAAIRIWGKPDGKQK